MSHVHPDGVKSIPGHTGVTGGPVEVEKINIAERQPLQSVRDFLEIIILIFINKKIKCPTFDIAFGVSIGFVSVGSVSFTFPISSRPMGSFFFSSFGLLSEMSMLTNLNKISSGIRLWLRVLRNDFGAGSALNLATVFCFFKLFSGTEVEVVTSEIFSLLSSVFFTILSRYLVEALEVSQATLEISTGSLAEVLDFDKSRVFSSLTDVRYLLRHLLGCGSFPTWMEDNRAEVLDLESDLLQVSGGGAGGCVGGGAGGGTSDSFTVVFEVDRTLSTGGGGGGATATLLRSNLALHLDNVRFGTKDSFKGGQTGS